jgi:hypothetical protein
MPTYEPVEWAVLNWPSKGQTTFGPSEKNTRVILEMARDYEALGKAPRGQARLLRREVTPWVELDD